ncbi:MAG: PqqD family protein [Acidobacteria bacterium]|nr:PqqD family protein [Acidobacteriota bacterium]MBV9477506.1 PqqD family protein [Acidobacteriota bacterium]
MISRDAVVVRTGDLVSAPMGDELAMMDMETGTYFVLDEIAAAIWEQLEQPTRVSALCSTLENRYDVSASQCEADVLPFLQSLHAKRLVRLVEEP